MKNNVIVYFVFMLIMPGCMMAHDFVVDGICYNVTSEKDLTCEVTFFADGSGAIKQGFYRDVVFLPETVNFDGREYKVTAIGENAFAFNDELLSVVMPNTISSIKHAAFFSCDMMKSITIPSGVVKIENGAFCGLGSLRHLAVDERNIVYDSRRGCNAIIETATNTLLYGCRTTEIPYGVEVIAMNAFWIIPTESDEPLALDIPGSVKTIDNCAFQTCKWLSGVTLHDGLMEIGDGAFRCTSLECVKIPETVTTIHPSAFAGIKRLKSIKVARGNRYYDSRKGCNAIIESAADRLMQACSTTFIPDGVKVIGGRAFSETDITGIVIPSSVESIEHAAFMGCHDLKSVVVPGSVKNIGKYAFSCCSGLGEVVVEEGVEKIGCSAFSMCVNLRRVSLPASLKVLGGPEYVLVFEKCSLLDEIVIPEENPHYYCFRNAIVEKSTLTVVDGCGLGNCNIDHGLREYSPKRIRKGAFRGLPYLTSLWLPGTLEVIEPGAFYDNPALRLIVCGSKIPPAIGEYTFDLADSNSTWHVPLQERVTVVVPEGSLEAYRNAPGWKEFKHIRE